MERAKQNSRVYTFNNFDLIHSNLVQISPIDSVPLQSISNDDGTSDFFIGNDISLLFNQERLSSLGPDTVKKFFDQLQSNSTSDSLKALRSKCSDSDLLQLCKSRFIQSPSELLSWSKYLTANFENLIQEVKSKSASSVDSADVPGSSDNVDSSTVSN